MCIDLQTWMKSSRLFLSWKCGRFCHALGLPMRMQHHIPSCMELTFFLSKRSGRPFAAVMMKCTRSAWSLNLWYSGAGWFWNLFKLFADFEDKDQRIAPWFSSHRNGRYHKLQVFAEFNPFHNGHKYLLGWGRGTENRCHVWILCSTEACYCGQVDTGSNGTREWGGFSCRICPF